MKILFITPNTTDSCSFYRTAGIAPDLREKLKMEIYVTSLDKEKFTWQNLLDYNLVMFQRPFSDTSLQMALYIKNMGIPLWVDFDDYLLDIPLGNPAYEVITKAREVIKKMTAIADVVSVTTDLLRQQLEPYSKNIRVIPNAFNDYVFKKRKNQDERSKMILWRGGDSHLPDLMMFAEPVTRVMKDYPEWIFTFMGMLPWFLDYSENMYHMPAQDPIFYFNSIASMASSVLHVPLIDNVFNRCKSNIAFIEAAYAGSACIAPAWDEWQKPGVMNYTDEVGYFAWIENVIKGEVNIKERSGQSWEYVMDCLMLNKINEQRVNLVRSLI
jgi:hypothetical protein